MHGCGDQRTRGDDERRGNGEEGMEKRRKGNGEEREMERRGSVGGCGRYWRRLGESWVSFG